MSGLPLFLMGLLLFLTSLFLILVVLVQRGRGGGLTGALGGMGGQSAFGAKAGDTFTRITIVTAIFWIALCMLTIKIFNPPVEADPSRAGINAGGGAAATGSPDVPPATDDGADEDVTDGGLAPADEGSSADDTPDADPDADEPSGELPGGGDFDGAPDDSRESNDDGAPETNPSSDDDETKQDGGDDG